MEVTILLSKGLEGFWIYSKPCIRELEWRAPGTSCGTDSHPAPWNLWMSEKDEGLAMDWWCLQVGLRKQKQELSEGQMNIFTWGQIERRSRIWGSKLSELRPWKLERIRRTRGAMCFVYTELGDEWEGTRSDSGYGVRRWYRFYTGALVILLDNRELSQISAHQCLMSCLGW